MLAFGLVGCGRIARKHAALLRDEIEGATLRAVCDQDPERAAAMGTEYGVPHYASIHAMMEAEEIGATSVLTPSGVHAQNVIELSRYGKPIVVEKPIALTLSDADRMVEACDKYGSKLFVVKQNRFNVPIQKLREAVEKGRFGKMVLGTVRVRWCRLQSYYDSSPWRGTWTHDGGVLANQASHHIDLLEWIMGDVESVFAKGSTALAKIEVEDTAVVVLRFRSGALGVIEATTATRPRDLEGSISILGERGSVEIGGYAANQLKTWNFEDETEDDTRVFERYSTNPQNPHDYAHKAYYDHVVECILGNKHQLVDGIAGRKSLELITAIYESIETGREVKLRFSPTLCKLGLPISA